MKSRYRVLVAPDAIAVPAVTLTTRWRWLAVVYAWLYCQVYAWGEAIVQERRQQERP